MNKLIIDYSQYNDLIEKLAIIIHKSDFKPTIIIGIMRGAALIVDILSRIFKLPVAYIITQSYTGEEIENIQGEIKFSDNFITIANDIDFKNILLVDDLSDTGKTFLNTIQWLNNNKNINNNINSIKTACLWTKKASIFKPDYCPIFLKDNPWIVQPNEKYDEININDILKKHNYTISGIHRSLNSLSLSSGSFPVVYNTRDLNIDINF